MQITSVIRRPPPIYVLLLTVLMLAAVARIAMPDVLERLSLACFDLRLERGVSGGGEIGVPAIIRPKYGSTVSVDVWQ